MSNTFKIMLIALVVIVIAATAYAFAAANTVPATNAGSGSGTISGYTISNVSYTLNTTDPTLLDAVSFTTNAAAAKVKIQVDTVSGTWYTCSSTDTLNWTCDTTVGTQATVAGMDKLTVVATSN
jgi:hypothetical protein